MSLKSINISALEQVEHTITKRLPVITGQDSFVDGGRSEDWHFSGPWSVMLERFNKLTGTVTKRLTATLTRTADGAFGELRYTITDYIKNTEATQGDPDSSLPGSTRENPSYELTTSEASAPLLTAPQYAKISGEAAQAFSMLMTGYAPTDLFDDTRTIQDVAEPASAELFALVQKGVTEYLVQRVTLTARYRASSPVDAPAMVIKAPPGPFGAVQEGRNWLYLGATQSYSNGEFWVTETYKLSGPGGWEEGLY